MKTKSSRCIDLASETLGEGWQKKLPPSSTQERRRKRIWSPWLLTLPVLIKVPGALLELIGDIQTLQYPSSVRSSHSSLVLQWVFFLKENWHACLLCCSGFPASVLTIPDPVQGISWHIYSAPTKFSKDREGHTDSRVCNRGKQIWPTALFMGSLWTKNDFWKTLYAAET